MKARLIGSSSLVALILIASPAIAQASHETDTPRSAEQQGQAQGQGGNVAPANSDAAGEDIIVTATRRNESVQDVPLSITAFTQHELTRKGIVGFDGLARETPGVVANKASANFVNLSARGVSTNGYSAGLQTSVAVYLDDLPLSTIGNTVTLDPNLYDVERVEFLRGPQGTLFGSGSLSGALRIITKSPELGRFDQSGLADIGVMSAGGGVRQRYNAMLNLPLGNTVALRVVGYYRHEDGYVDNVGTGVKNANTLVDWGGRAELLWKPSDRFDVKLLASYENSDPKDSSLSNPLLGKRKRYSTQPDVFSTKLAAYNAVIDYQLGFAKLTSSTTYSYDPGKFYVDLAGTFNTPGTTSLPIPFFLDDDANYKTFVEETRIVSDPGGKFDWVIGGYYLHRELDLNGRELSTPAYLASLGITGLPADGTFYGFGSDTKSYELAGFGELTYHLSDKLWVTGGLRYGKYGTTVKTDSGFNSNYITVAYYKAFYGLSYPFAVAPNDATFTRYPSAAKASWKASLSFKPSSDLTTYATVSTGYRTPVYNAQAGSVSLVDPNDIVIPTGAGSDKLFNYEVGLKGQWLNGRLSANLAAYYIDWSNIQVQANRPSDSIQFATNVGAAHSKGFEFELLARPFAGFSLGVNGSIGDAKVVSLTPEQALISGAVKGARLAAPHFQGAVTGTYSYDLPSQAHGFTSVSLQHVGSFPNQFPNAPGTGLPSPLFGFTDSYENLDIQSGINIGAFSVTAYMENVTDSSAVTYIHPENFIFNRYLRLRPRTFGVRVGWNL